MKKTLVSATALSILLAFGLSSCKNENKYSSPPGYDFTKAEKFNMPSSLLEISGIAFKNSNSDTVYSIQDEDGKLFKQQWHVKKQQNVKFASKGDFEDLAIVKDQVIALKSNGNFYTFPVSEIKNKETKNVKDAKKLLPKGEYEGIYADESNNDIYVLCKNCPVDKKNKQVTGYILKFAADSSNFALTDSFKVDLKKIPLLNDKLKPNLNPSAIAKNRLTNEWFILSTMNKLLVVTDTAWNIKAVHKLNSSVFNQPEGIAFDKQNNLFISNEGDEITDGNVLKFKYLKSK
ncbi:SdiA-regulated domain-containing protein [Pedobacter sp. PWIIR3]